MLELSIINRQDMELNALTMIVVDLLMRDYGYTSSEAVDKATNLFAYFAPESVTSWLDRYYNKNERHLNTNTWTLEK